MLEILGTKKRLELKLIGSVKRIFSPSTPTPAKIPANTGPGSEESLFDFDLRSVSLNFFLPHEVKQKLTPIIYHTFVT